MQVSIITNRLQLRPFSKDDVSDLFEMDSDPEVHKYLGNHPAVEISECEATLIHVQKQYEENGLGRLIIVEKETGELIGWSGLKYEKFIRKKPYYDLGYRLKQKFWGKGMATESAIASLNYGFNDLNIEKICAAAHIDNIASNKILRKLGFRQLETFVFESARHNWYEITKIEWKNSEVKERVPIFIEKLT